MPVSLRLSGWGLLKRACRVRLPKTLERPDEALLMANSRRPGCERSARLSAARAVWQLRPFSGGGVTHVARVAGLTKWSKTGAASRCSRETGSHAAPHSENLPACRARSGRTDAAPLGRKRPRPPDRDMIPCRARVASGTRSTMNTALRCSQWERITAVTSGAVAVACADRHGGRDPGPGCARGRPVARDLRVLPDGARG